MKRIGTPIHCSSILQLCYQHSCETTPRLVLNPGAFSQHDVLPATHMNTKAGRTGAMVFANEQFCVAKSSHRCFVD